MIWHQKNWSLELILLSSVIEKLHFVEEDVAFLERCGKIHNYTIQYIDINSYNGFSVLFCRKINCFV